MTRTAADAVDAGAVSPSRALATVARLSAQTGGPLVCVTHRAYAELVAGLGFDEAVARRLAMIAMNTGWPIAVNLPTGPDHSQTAFVAPKDWSRERLAGCAAGHIDELEAAFGPASVRPLGGL